jgi:type I restriction enzyme S subunit
MALCDRLEAQQQEREEQASQLARASLARFADAPSPANVDYLFHSSYSISPSDLRKSILTLAVQGKLVPQDPNDEPADVLLTRIRRKKGGVEDDDTGTDEKPSLTGGFSPPFEIPSTWAWVRSTEPTQSISDLGKKIKTKDVAEKGRFPVVDQGKQFIRGYCDDEEKVIHHDTPIVLFGDHTRETKLIDFDFVVGADGVKLLKPIEINPSYYLLALRWLPLDDRGYGRHFKLLRAASIPIPPLAEQRRIVAKVEQLMALVDALETQLAASRATAANLLSALVAELTA